MATGIVSLTGYVLPPPAPVLNLFYALGCLLEYPPADLQNVCGDPDWAAIRKVMHQSTVCLRVNDIVNRLIDQVSCDSCVYCRWCSFRYCSFSRIVHVCRKVKACWQTHKKFVCFIFHLHFR